MDKIIEKGTAKYINTTFDTVTLINVKNIAKVTNEIHVAKQIKHNPSGFSTCNFFSLCCNSVAFLVKKLP